MAIGAGASVVPGRVQPLLGVTILELLGVTVLVVLGTGRAEPRPVVALVPMETPRPMMPWPLPAPSRRMMAEVAGPRLRSQVPFGVVVMMHHLGTIAYDDADAEG